MSALGGNPSLASRDRTLSIRMDVLLVLQIEKVVQDCILIS